MSSGKLFVRVQEVSHEMSLGYRYTPPCLCTLASFALSLCTEPLGTRLSSSNSSFPSNSITRRVRGLIQITLPTVRRVANIFSPLIEYYFPSSLLQGRYKRHVSRVYVRFFLVLYGIAGVVIYNRLFNISCIVFLPNFRGYLFLGNFAMR